MYTDTLTPKGLIKGVATIKKAFPSLPIEFYDVFADILEKEGFTDDRLEDAVNHVITTCTYPTPTIANFIGFDKKIEINTYEAMLKKSQELGALVWENYTPIKFPDREKPVWIRNDDVRKYNIKSDPMPRK